MENKRGITLIALVVTIIVLIILAGVSINLVLGDNGIITKAKTAKKDTDETQIEEEIQMMIGECQIDNEDKITLDNLQLWIGNNKPDISIIDNRPEETTIDLYYKDKIIKVSDILEIVEIRDAEFKVKISKKVEDEKVTIRAEVTSTIEDITVISIKFGETIQEGSEATFNLNYPRNL